MRWQQVMGKEILGEKRNEITWLLSKYLFDDEIGDRRCKEQGHKAAAVL